MDNFKKYPKNDDLKDAEAFKFIAGLKDEDVILEKAMALITKVA